MYSPEVTPEDVARHFLALGHSLDVINKVIDGTDTDENGVLRVKLNYQHLEIMLEKSFILESGTDLTQYREAIIAGKTFVEQNEQV